MFVSPKHAGQDRHYLKNHAEHGIRDAHSCMQYTFVRSLRLALELDTEDD